jgi:hypothetical protein
MTFKQKVHQHYINVVSNKIKALQELLADLKETGTNETKSTAGDKHETALAMLQIEQAKVRDQLKIVEEQKAVLLKINASLTTTAIVLGSLIKTNKGYFYFSVALGKAIVDVSQDSANENIIALSPQSPLGMQLKGLQVGEIATINKTHYKIEAIF